MSPLLLATLLLCSDAPALDARASLVEALAADAAGDGETANTLLARLSDERTSRQALGLDLVEAWWRVSHQERAINTLSKWRQEAPRSPDPVVRARARALTGSPFDPAAAWQTFTAPDAPPDTLCRVLSVAQALDAVGQRDAGQDLLDRAWAISTCPDAAQQRATWERPKDPTVAPRAPSPPPAVRQVLGPGHEARVVRVMPEKPGELPDGIGLIHLMVPEALVEAHYGPLGDYAERCDEAPLCVTLHHRSLARRGDRLVGAFALRTGGQKAYDTKALLDGITARLKAEGDWDPWVETTRPAAPETEPTTTLTATEPPRAPDRRVWIVVGLLLIMALVLGLRARARRKAAD